jgi:hypothetical protein
MIITDGFERGFGGVHDADETQPAVRENKTCRL